MTVLGPSRRGVPSFTDASRELDSPRRHFGSTGACRSFGSAPDAPNIGAEHIGSVDITVPADFPKTDYMEVEQRLSTYLGGLGVSAGGIRGFSGYAGGWNAVILRFRAASEDCIAAASLLACNQGSLSNEQRYQQERSLLGFFVNAQSAVESCCFAVYHIACMRNPGAFLLEEHHVNPNSAQHAIAPEYPGSTLAAELTNLAGDTTWKQIKHIRRVLFHRMHPPTTFFIATLGAPPPRPAEWTGRGVVLEPALVIDRRGWLGAAISGLVGATLDFVKTQF